MQSNYLSIINDSGNEFIERNKIRWLKRLYFFNEEPLLTHKVPLLTDKEALFTDKEALLTDKERLFTSKEGLFTDKESLIVDEEVIWRSMNTC